MAGARATRGGVYRRADLGFDALVCVISNEIFHTAGPHVIVVPVFPIPDEVHASQTGIDEPVRGFLTPTMVHWLPASALGEYLGTADNEAVDAVARTVAACVT
jgi:mRNA-degrading endonuclease toxin of MazEF toxin-antitoxin module